MLLGRHRCLRSSRSAWCSAAKASPPRSPTRTPPGRDTQFYSMLAMRALYHQGWLATTLRPCGRRPTGASSGSVNDGSGDVSLSGPTSASITQYGLGKPDAVVAEGPQMVSWESRCDTPRRDMRGRKMPAAAGRRGNGRTASCRTLPLIFGAPQSAGPTLLQRGMTAAGWHARADEARSLDPTSLGGRSPTPQCVNRRRGTMGQENSGHGVMFITRAAAHESRWGLDSPGSSTQNTDAPPGFPCRRRCDTNNPALASSRESPSAPTRIDDSRFERGCRRRNRRPAEGAPSRAVARHTGTVSVTRATIELVKPPAPPNQPA
jgi:hypothetical protein